MSTPIQVREQRDPKGLYGMAKAGKLAHFTGISGPCEAPEEPDLVIDTLLVSVEEEESLDARLANPDNSAQCNR